MKTLPNYPNPKPVFKQKEYQLIQKSLDQIFLKMRGYTFRMPPPNSSVILLLSGGFDSVGLWNLLMGKYKLNVYPVHLSSPHPLKRFHHHYAISYYKNVLKKKYPSFYRSPIFYPNPVRNSLLTLFGNRYQEKLIQHPELLINNLHRAYGHTVTTLIAQPTRLGHMAHAAYETLLKLRYKMNVDISTILYALTPEDASLLRESSLQVLRSINLCLSLTLGDFSIQVSAPIENKSIFNIKKREILLFANNSNLSLNHSWSCVQKGIFHCGYCYNCIERKIIYQTTHTSDKTWYSPFSLLYKYIKKNSAKKTGCDKSLKPNINKLKATTKLLLSPKLKLLQQSSSSFIYNTDTGFIEQLNQTGDYIIQILKQPKTIRNVTKFIQVKYPSIALKKIETDVLVFLEEQIKNQNISVSS